MPQSTCISCDMRPPGPLNPWPCSVCNDTGTIDVVTRYRVEKVNRFRYRAVVELEGTGMTEETDTISPTRAITAIEGLLSNTDKLLTGPEKLALSLGLEVVR